MARFRKNIKRNLLCVRAPESVPEEAPGEQGRHLAATFGGRHGFWI
jgi:hypothetical protein